MNNQERTPEEIAIEMTLTSSALSQLRDDIAAIIRAERTVKESLIVERDELKAECARLRQQVSQPLKEPTPPEPTNQQKLNPHLFGGGPLLDEMHPYGHVNLENSGGDCDEGISAPEPANPSKAREKSIHEVIQSCMAISCYETISRFSDALIAERAARDKWKERAEKAEAERDRLKAVVSAIVQRFAHLTITGPFVTNYEIRDYFRNELAAARAALKGPNQ